MPVRFIFLIILFICPLFFLSSINLSASGPPVTGLNVTFYPGTDLYGNATIEVQAEWDPWVLMIQCSPSQPEKNALIEYRIVINTAGDEGNCIPGSMTTSSFNTTATSYHTAISPYTLYLQVTVYALYIFPGCSVSTFTDPAEWYHNFSCDYVDFPTLPRDSCSVRIGTAGEPVNVTNGEMYVTHSDFSFPGR